MDNTQVKRIAVTTLAVASMIIGASALNAQDERLDKIVKEVKGTNVLAKASQTKIDTMADQTSDLFGKYKRVLKTNDGLKAYNNQLNKAIIKQREEIIKINDAIAGIAKIKRQITPLMLDMVESLKQFVENDIPFEKEKRMERLANLQNAIDDPQVAESEKFRVTLQEYQNEVGYGRSVYAWEGTLDDGRSVNFVRIGRIGYYYQTQDRSETAAWDVANATWQVLPDDNTRPINRLIKMANKLIPFDLAIVPIAAPEGK